MHRCDPIHVQHSLQRIAGNESVNYAIEGAQQNIYTRL